MQLNYWKKRTGFRHATNAVYSSQGDINGILILRGVRFAFFNYSKSVTKEQGWEFLYFLFNATIFSRIVFDSVYKEFPALRRDDPYFQEFKVQLTSNGSRIGTSGFLELYNATTGEIVPSCDRQFTIRNAQVNSPLLISLNSKFEGRLPRAWLQHSKCLSLDYASLRL
jgi:hypothetical protein